MMFKNGWIWDEEKINYDAGAEAGTWLMFVLNCNCKNVTYTIIRASIQPTKCCWIQFFEEIFFW